MPQKKVDSRVRTLIENGVKLRERTFLVLVGDRGRDQVVNLHFMLSKAAVKARPSVLWCYKKDLGFSTHRKKRMRQIKKLIKRGLYDPDKENPFDLFISSTNIRYTYYKDTHKILGSTYGMCVLQDFEALTPNLLCRTIETVEGGGLVVLLLRTMTSLKQLYAMTMDVHSRYRTERHQDIVARFNERFILSLGSCKRCLVLDDELNVLPLSKHCKDIVPLPAGKIVKIGKDSETLKEMKREFSDTPTLGTLVSLACTSDQAKAVAQCVEVIADKTLRSTVSVTAARGRGKSAALGISIAGAVAYGYSNIFITSPNPENLGTVFEFLFRGLDAMGYQDHTDYEILRDGSSETGIKNVVRVNIFRNHRQTIQYIAPSNDRVLSQAELLVIDEAAAIPLPVVKALLGPYLVFMSSTVVGYEGTGRALSLKLVKELRDKANRATSGSKSGTRKLREITLDEPIRYAPGDGVERWMNDLLCLDATDSKHRITGGVPHPRDCELFSISRDTLFSYHRLSEEFLQKIVSLFVSSHYKNSPNDMLLMSDAPAHRIFALLGNVDDAAENGGLPDVLCAIQVALEGEINSDVMQSSLSKGKRASGDLIPWTVSQQYQESSFGSLSGARVVRFVFDVVDVGMRTSFLTLIHTLLTPHSHTSTLTLTHPQVRIAVHPDVQRMGYGSRALQQLTEYFEGKLLDVDAMEAAERETFSNGGQHDLGNDLNTETLAPRTRLPPLLVPLSEKRPESIHWIGTSFGLTPELFRFWFKDGYRPLYVRQTPNELTGEHSTVLLKPVKSIHSEKNPESGWLNSFSEDFTRRVVNLLSYQFSSLSTSLALNLLNHRRDSTSSISSSSSKKQIVNLVRMNFLPHDLKRLDAYSRNLVDHHLIRDLIPIIARLYFTKSVDISLSQIQAAVLLGVGLQHKTVQDLSEELNLPSGQLFAMFNKSMRKTYKYLQSVVESEIEAEVAPRIRRAMETEAEQRENVKPLKSMDRELSEAGKIETQKIKDKQKRMVDALEAVDLMQYAVGGSEEQWSKALGDAEDSGGRNVIRLSAETSSTFSDNNNKKKRKRSGSIDQIKQLKKAHAKKKKEKKSAKKKKKKRS